jgi:hypothetical protein
MKRLITALLFGLLAVNVGLCQENVMKIDMKGKNVGNGPLTIPLSVPKAWAGFDEVAVDVVTTDDVVKTFGQLTAPGIATEAIQPTKNDTVRRDLYVVLPVKGSELVVHFKKVDPQVTRFAWTAKKGEYDELSLTRSGTLTRVLRYMDRPYDISSKDAREKSYKVFHHLYDPTGKRFVTNGGFTNDNITDPKKLLYPHHRGIMYGFNKCTYGPGLKKKADTWHCTGDAHIAHEKTLSTETGPLLGRHRVLIGWFGEKNERFAEEERELTAYNLPGGTLVEFASRLKTTNGKVKLDGDPQHAGFQFRAANDVATTSKKQTYYLHPDGTKGEMGKERNWPADKGMVDLPWYAVNFVLDGQRYSVTYLNHPSNPSPTRFSERDYARFGGYFEAEVTEKAPLVVQYRLWLQNGEVTAEQATAMRAAFAAAGK